MALGEQGAAKNDKRKERLKKKSSKKDLTAKDRAFKKLDLRQELKKLEEMISQLKLDYEQYFLGISPYKPDALQKAVKKQIRTIRKAPFKHSWVNYKLRSLEGRYHTFNDYWERCNRQREDGVYSRDVFKANLRERMAQEDAAAQTETGKASKQMVALYDSYKQALEKASGKKANVDFTAFQKTLKKQAKAYQEKFGKKKMGFKITVKDGKVKIKAKGV